MKGGKGTGDGREGMELEGKGRDQRVREGGWGRREGVAMDSLPPSKTCQIRHCLTRSFAPGPHSGQSNCFVNQQDSYFLVVSYSFSLDRIVTQPTVM